MNSAQKTKSEERQSIREPQKKKFWKLGAGIQIPKTSKGRRIMNQEKIEPQKEETARALKIKGKNVDDLDLEKLGNLIQQANEKSSKINLRGLFKSLKKSRPDNSQGK
jgi:hypothetical protein